MARIGARRWKAETLNPSDSFSLDDAPPVRVIGCFYVEPAREFCRQRFVRLERVVGIKCHSVLGYNPGDLLLAKLDDGRLITQPQVWEIAMVLGRPRVGRINHRV